ncbi:hypothetical protein SAMN04488525_101794 [Trichococcus collinsii]|uniref:Uncharacterized protein n=1 Tax=Trichococcus collinsii TaxID=157076 RepID=A0AB37ZZ08_9LACT|nr:hypothetical protein SAMN04488525_101794 [Trichococcus collinsii]
MSQLRQAFCFITSLAEEMHKKTLYFQLNVKKYCLCEIPILL